MKVSDIRQQDGRFPPSSLSLESPRNNSFAVEHDPMEPSPGADDVADPVLESVGCGEEEVAVEPDNSDAGRLLVVGIVGDVPVDLCARLTPKQSDIGACGHSDQPQQRECDADRSIRLRALRKRSASLSTNASKLVR